MADRPHDNNIRLNIDGPRGSVDVVPDDNNDVAPGLRGLWIETGGDIRVTFEGNADGSSQLVRNIPGGAYWSGFVKRVWASDLTATIGFGVI
jgi:hypothetical protein